MNFETLKYEIQDRVLTITLNRPDRMNAFTGKMSIELSQAFNAADQDDGVRAVVVTGSGEKAFCAGADLEAGAGSFDYDSVESLAGESDNVDRMRDTGGNVTLSIFNCRKPIIAAINGAAVGIGATMTLPMDIRLASDNARFGFVFTRRGIVPEAASSWFLPRLVGISQALEWTLRGNVFDAEEALRGGLVKAVVPQAQLLEQAYAIARDIADNTSAVSVALTRQMMWRMLGADHPMEAHKIDSRGVYYTGKSSDAKEGVMSFLEKRPAKFTDTVTENMPEFYPWWEEPKFS